MCINIHQLKKIVGEIWGICNKTFKAGIVLAEILEILTIEF